MCKRGLSVLMDQPRAFYRFENVAGLSAILATTAIALTLMSDDGGRSGHWSLDRVVILAVALTFGIGAVRAATMRLTVGRRTVKLRNLFRTYRWPTTDVESLDLAEYRFIAQSYVRLHLVSGEKHSVSALQPPNPGFRPSHHRSRDLVDSANEEFLRIRGL